MRFFFRKSKVRGNFGQAVVSSTIHASNIVGDVWNGCFSKLHDTQWYNAEIYTADFWANIQIRRIPGRMGNANHVNTEERQEPTQLSRGDPRSTFQETSWKGNAAGMPKNIGLDVLPDAISTKSKTAGQRK